MSHKKEIERLNRKIQWYVENQQLLDKDVDVLKEKDNEIRRLKVTLDNLQSEVCLGVDLSMKCLCDYVCVVLFIFLLEFTLISS